MTQARPVLPTDLLSLVAFNGRGWQNEVWPRERLGAPVTTGILATAREQLLAITRRRNAWVSIRHQRLRGLVGARRRGGRHAWEVDFLVDATGRRAALPGLLECALSDASRAGVEKLFLRLAADSDLVDVVREVGFLPFRQETLFAGRAPAPDGACATRPASTSDAYPLFRLYCDVTPETVRRYEAATYGEWQSAQERRWQRGAVQLVRDHDGRLDAWVKAARLPQGVAVELLLDAAALESTSALVGAAVAAVGGGERVLILLPDGDEGAARRLEQAGFAAGERFLSLIKRTTRTVSLPKLSPAVAKTALGA